MNADLKSNNMSTVHDDTINQKKASPGESEQCDLVCTDIEELIKACFTILPHTVKHPSSFQLCS